MKTYALYKGDELLSIGTTKELAELRGVAQNTILYYSYPSYQLKGASKKRPSNRLVVIPLDDDDDQDE